MLAAILVLPPIFIWIVLRRGYSRDVRTGGFLYAFLLPALQLAALLLEPGARG